MEYKWFPPKYDFFLRRNNRCTIFVNNNKPQILKFRKDGSAIQFALRLQIKTLNIRLNI